MADLHRLPLLGHDLPKVFMATNATADGEWAAIAPTAPKAPKRHRVRVFSYMDSGRRYWAWAHPCDKDSALGESCYPCWETAQWFGAAHAKRCC